MLPAIFDIWGGPFLIFRKTLRDYFCAELCNRGIIVSAAKAASLPFLCFLPSLSAHWPLCPAEEIGQPSISSHFVSLALLPLLKWRKEDIVYSIFFNFFSWVFHYHCSSLLSNANQQVWQAPKIGKGMSGTPSLSFMFSLWQWGAADSKAVCCVTRCSAEHAPRNHHKSQPH